MKKILFVVLVFCCLQLSAQDKATVQILANLQSQQTAWNEGNIESFMQYYWKSDSLLFIGRSGPEYGWQTTKDNYKKSYPDKATMGELNFTILHAQKISKSCYNIIGKWDLIRSKGNVGGYFTLLWKKINGAWVIVQDHTS